MNGFETWLALCALAGLSAALLYVWALAAHYRSRLRNVEMERDRYESWWLESEERHEGKRPELRLLGRR